MEETRGKGRQPDFLSSSLAVESGGFASRAQAAASHNAPSGGGGKGGGKK
jgi:hypothetical protein